MNGAESVVRSLHAAGTEVCFANPGTSEMQFVDALDRTRLMRCVLGLFEGVVTGAASAEPRQPLTTRPWRVRCADASSPCWSAPA